MSKSMQHQLAELMESDLSSYGGEEYGAEAEAGPGRASNCCMRSCSASSCRNNADGARCTLEVITINDAGGCAEYEAAADEFEDDDADAIQGISAMIPELPDHPSSNHNMVGKYAPDMGR